MFGQYQLIKSTKEKIQRNPRRSVRKVAATAKVRRTLMCRVLKKDLRTHPNEMFRRHELTQVYLVKKLEKSRLILRQLAEGKLPNLVIIGENKLTSKRQ